MSHLFDQGGRTLKCLFLALIVLFAQQAAQLHALAHAQDELAQPHKGKPASHPLEQCIAFHAIDSALVATAALQNFDFLQSEQPTWIPVQTQARARYFPPSRAPPRAV
jgi:hypothetical protein